MVVSVSGQNGAHVQKNVEREKRLEQGPVQILLLYMVVKDVKGRLAIQGNVKTRNAQVIIYFR